MYYVWRKGKGKGLFTVTKNQVHHISVEMCEWSFPPWTVISNFKHTLIHVMILSLKNISRNISSSFHHRYQNVKPDIMHIKTTAEWRGDSFLSNSFSFENIKNISLTEQHQNISLTSFQTIITKHPYFIYRDTIS